MLEAGTEGVSLRPLSPWTSFLIFLKHSYMTGPVSGSDVDFSFDKGLLKPWRWGGLLVSANTCSDVRRILDAFGRVSSVHPAESICLHLIVKS